MDWCLHIVMDGKVSKLFAKPPWKKVYIAIWCEKIEKKYCIILLNAPRIYM